MSNESYVESASVDLSSTSFDLEECVVLSTKEVKAAQKKSKQEKKNEKNKEKQQNKNIISKNDLHLKKEEFRKWLSEKKGVQLEKLSKRRLEALFKKFVKKWNNNKLPKQYYRETGDLWALASPRTQTQWTLPPALDLAVSGPQGTLVSPRVAVDSTTAQNDSVAAHSRSPLPDAPFGTFGKKSGAQLLTRMKAYFDADTNNTRDDVIPVRVKSELQLFDRTNHSRTNDVVVDSNDQDCDIAEPTGLRCRQRPSSMYSMVRGDPRSASMSVTQRRDLRPTSMYATLRRDTCTRSHRAEPVLTPKPTGKQSSRPAKLSTHRSVFEVFSDENF